jgi:putative acetyltransferase
MAEDITTREGLPDDRAAIEALYVQALPQEDLLPLLRDLLQETGITLSLVATVADRLVGHIAFTLCTLPDGGGKAALLGPLAVVPAQQRQGVGSALVWAGLHRLEDAGVNHALVLGDPAYYGRFGFLPEAGVAPPYVLPTEWAQAWQSKRMGGAAAPGTLPVPAPWRRPALWAP